MHRLKQAADIYLATYVDAELESSMHKTVGNGSLTFLRLDAQNEFEVRKFLTQRLLEADAAVA